MVGGSNEPGPQGSYCRCVEGKKMPEGEGMSGGCGLMTDGDAAGCLCCCRHCQSRPFGLIPEISVGGTPRLPSRKPPIFRGLPCQSVCKIVILKGLRANSSSQRGYGLMSKTPVVSGVSRSISIIAGGLKLIRHANVLDWRGFC